MTAPSARLGFTAPPPGLLLRQAHVHLDFSALVARREKTRQMLALGLLMMESRHAI
jgi:hypothetical protein